MSRLAFWPKRTIAFTVVFRYTQVATLPLRRLEYSSYDAELPVAYGEEKVVVRTWLASFALLLTFGIAAHAWGDTLADEMAALNARWDAAINDPNPDALVPM